MHQHQCEICGRPATIHETSLASGAVSDRHVCYAHGEAMLLKPTAEQREDFRALVEYFRGLSAAEHDQIALSYRLSRRFAS